MRKRLAEESANGSKEDDLDSRSGSENLDEDDLVPPQHPSKKKRYHRHTPFQIQQLESLFKECPHPDEKQRLELSERLRLESRQIKFWFQNRRTQMKAQLERHQNSLLKQENDRLKMENMAMRESARNSICPNCLSSMSHSDVSLEEQHLRLENARLKEHLYRAERLLSHPFTESASLEHLAMAAAEEFEKMAEMEEPVWFRDDSGKWVLDWEEYSKISSLCLGAKPHGFVSMASRETAIVPVGAALLAETLMDADRWPGMFPSLVGRATSVVAGNGALRLVRCELQVVSPLVAAREVRFMRACKELAEGVWAVVDVSVEGSAAYRRLPSGCLLREVPGGFAKVTWVEHAEYEEAAVHDLYRPLIRSGAALGAQRWLGALQRQCDCLAILMSSSADDDSSAISPPGRRSMVKLASRMTDNFCSAISASSTHGWVPLTLGGTALGDNVRVMTRCSEPAPGETAGLVLSAATSVWIPVDPPKLFHFLRDDSLRSEWDILSNGAPMHEVARVPKGCDQGNSVSLLRASAGSGNQTSMLILQETCTDPSASLIVYAPVDPQSMHLVMNGGDSSTVALLPSGFAVMPDGLAAERRRRGDATGDSPTSGGSLLTVGFQILVNSLPAAKLTVESAETVNNLISCTIKKIKEALRCGG